jgi:hypothetical protein
LKTYTAIRIPGLLIFGILMLPLTIPKVIQYQLEHPRPKPQQIKLEPEKYNYRFYGERKEE